VTNGLAEGGVVFMRVTEFNFSLARDEKQKHPILQVVEHHRRKFSIAKKIK